jgi:hypothetical protein
LGYKVEEKLNRGVREQTKRLNATGLDDGLASFANVILTLSVIRVYDVPEIGSSSIFRRTGQESKSSPLDSL